MTIQFIIRIIAAAILGSSIGLEREYRAKEAGFRTHFLVALGSCLFMILSQYGFDSVLHELKSASFDPSRIASQVVTGIGFIGAGTIIFQKQAVRGLTTAAGLWVTAAIGMTCGSGMYILALASTLFVLLGLEVLHFALNRFGLRHVNIQLSVGDKSELDSLIKDFENQNIRIGSLFFYEKQEGDEKYRKMNVQISIKRNDYNSRIISLILPYPNIELISIE